MSEWVQVGDNLVVHGRFIWLKDELVRWGQDYMDNLTKESSDKDVLKQKACLLRLEGVEGTPSRQR